MANAVAEAVLVDTDVFSYLMSGSRYAALYRPHVEGKLIAVSFITVGELYFGAKRKNWGSSKLADLKDRLRTVTIVPYDVSVCLKYAEIKAQCEAKGKTVADNDLWIAACAIRHSIPLVSNNFKHFNGIPGLVLKSESQAMQEMQAQTRIEVEMTEIKSSSSEPQPPSSQSSSVSGETAPPPAPRRL
jgi:predicted nucleic acid-binding protein